MTQNHQVVMLTPPLSILVKAKTFYLTSYPVAEFIKRLTVISPPLCSQNELTALSLVCRSNVPTRSKCRLRKLTGQHQHEELWFSILQCKPSLFHLLFFAGFFLTFYFEIFRSAEKLRGGDVMNLCISLTQTNELLRFCHICFKSVCEELGNIC